VFSLGYIALGISSKSSVEVALEGFRQHEICAYENCEGEIECDGRNHEAQEWSERSEG